VEFISYVTHRYHKSRLLGIEKVLLAELHDYPLRDACLVIADLIKRWRAIKITGILVALYVADTQALYVMLGADGTIHRMGNGTEWNAEQDLFIGTSPGRHFEQLHRLVPPHFLRWLGRYADPHPQGKRSRCTISLRLDDGEELCSQWEYGTKSQGPPEEIAEFVRAAVAITDHWYEQQLQLARRS
jgi:hypothetical protein